jgi:hypothetical protein
MTQARIPERPNPQDMSRAKSLHRTATIVALGLIGMATLGPGSGDAWPHDFWGWRTDTVELALNVLLFVPLGLALRKTTPGNALLAVGATTVSIELLQYFVIVGRDGSMRDVVANFTGGAGGFLAGPCLRWLWLSDARTSRRLAWSATVLWIAHAALAMILFRPSVADSPLYTHLAPELGQYDTFAGTVANASVNDIPVSIGRFPAAAVGHSWESHPLELTATATTSSPTHRLAPVLALIDSAGIELALLGESRSDLVFRTRTLADKLGLRRPVLVIDTVFAPAARAFGEPLHIAARRDRYSLSARLTYADGASRGGAITLRPSLAWSFWWTFDVPSSTTIRWMAWLWLALPACAIGFWSAMSANDLRTRRSLLLPGIALIIANALVPWFFGVAPQRNMADTVALATGLLVGFFLAALRAQRVRAQVVGFNKG